MYNASVVLLLTLSLALSASEAAEPVDPSTASLHASTTAPAGVAELLEHFKTIDKNLAGLEARFIQTVELSDAGVAQRVEGSVLYQKPERLRLEHLKPERQTVVSDGKTLWIHRIDRNQVISSDLEDWKQSDPTAARLLDFGNYEALLKNYEVRYDTKTLEATLRPKDPKEELRLRLKLAAPAWFPAETELSVGRLRVATRFAGLRFNPVFPEGTFRFTPPEGADVFKNFKPPKPPGDAR